MNINQGNISGDKYYKVCKFSEAVLWKDRALSLRPDIMNLIQKSNVNQIIFIDQGTMKEWIFDAKDVYANMTLKQVGQEPQYYFSIDIRKEDTNDKHVDNEQKKLGDF